MEKGNTARVLTSFLEGMKDGGYDVELFYSSSLSIKPCACGEMYCWYKKPGECCFQDDMQMLYAKLREADILILATPVYIPLPGAMQDLINRLCPLTEPRIETREGRTRVKFRDDIAITKFALVSTGGWWELGNFDTVVRIAVELAENTSVQFAGAMLRPHASLMRREGELTEDGKAVLKAAKRAGHELATEGVMSAETLADVSRPLISEEGLRQTLNSMLDEVAGR
jgi:multimeric flavodoxin WrbA